MRQRTLLRIKVPLLLFLLAVRTAEGVTINVTDAVAIVNSENVMVNQNGTAVNDEWNSTAVTPQQAEHQQQVQQQPSHKTFRFVLAAKSIGNPFFDVSRDGCLDRADEMTRLLTGANFDIQVECIYMGPEIENLGGLQAQMIHEMLANSTDEKVDGISISVRDAASMRPVMQSLPTTHNIPVVTFDSDIDVPALRHSYIGTDNFFFGQELGKVLKQIRPTGGTFAIVTDTAQNIVQREQGLRQVLVEDDADSHNTVNLWHEVTESPQYGQGNGSLMIEQMRYLAETHPDITAIVPVMGAPMFLQEDWKRFVKDFAHITFVVADGLPMQLALLGRNYVQGLVAQLPYQMGVMSMDSLMALALNQSSAATEYLSQDDIDTIHNLLQLPPLPLPDFQGTNVLEHLQVPLVLPPLEVNENHLGRLAIIGYTLFAIVFVTAAGFATWTWKYRRVEVVTIAQPVFLIMVAFGSLVLGSTIIPLSLDDSTFSPSSTSSSSSLDSTNSISNSNDNMIDAYRGIIVCMSIPWLAFMGFTITFSALLAKTWRINQLIQASGNFKRVRLTTAQVAKPFLLLLAANAVVLTVWTFNDPLHYVRRDMPGLDPWNRVIATYGACESTHNATPYLAVLATLNLLVLLVANWQAYRARHIVSEFSESHYIAICMASMLQSALIGVPLLFLVKDMPQAFYLTITFIVFTIVMVILLLIFVPKVAFAKRFLTMDRASQRNVIQDALAQSSEHALGNSCVSPGRRSARLSSNAGSPSCGGANTTSLRNRRGAIYFDTGICSVRDFMEAAKIQKQEHQQQHHVSDILESVENGSDVCDNSFGHENNNEDKESPNNNDTTLPWQLSKEYSNALESLTKSCLTEAALQAAAASMGDDGSEITSASDDDDDDDDENGGGNIIINVGTEELHDDNITTLSKLASEYSSRHGSRQSLDDLFPSEETTALSSVAPETLYHQDGDDLESGEILAIDDDQYNP